jgi:predicted transcriptional regulator
MTDLRQDVEALTTCREDSAEEERLRQGLEDIAEGRTRSAREVFAELREEYGILG